MSRVSLNGRDPLLGTSEGSRYGLRALLAPDVDDNGSMQLPEKSGRLNNPDADVFVVTLCAEDAVGGIYMVKSAYKNMCFHNTDLCLIT